MDIPRLRMFAGPNGSGKSTLKELLSPDWLGIYINADDIERAIRVQGGFRVSDFDIELNQQQLTDFLSQSTLLNSQGLAQVAQSITIVDGYISFGGLSVNSYFASALADLMRRRLLENGESFTFETVMSSPDKVELLCDAQKRGYRTYLYYVATEDAEINIDRVKTRVEAGGHDVPRDKIVTRYERSLELLNHAVACSNRAFIFDNSNECHVWVAEVTDGAVLESKVGSLPDWCRRSLWDKFSD